MWMIMHLFNFSCSRWASSTRVCLRAITWTSQNVKVLSACACACRLSARWQFVSNGSLMKAQLRSHWTPEGMTGINCHQWRTFLHITKRWRGEMCVGGRKRWMRQGEKVGLGWREVWREMSRKRRMLRGNGQIDKREMARGFFLSRAWGTLR